WINAAPPTDTNFYQMTIGSQQKLSADAALIKFGAALIKAGRMQESVAALGRAIVEWPDNTEPIQFLSDALETASQNELTEAIVSLRQVALVNRETTLVFWLLCRSQVRSAKPNDPALVV